MTFTDAISWISENALTLCSAAGSLATVAAAAFAAFEFRRQSKLSKRQLEEKFDAHKASANKLLLQVTEHRNMGPDINTPSISIELENRSTTKFSNIIVQVPEVKVKSSQLQQGQVPTADDADSYSLAPEIYDEPHKWMTKGSADRFRVGNQPTTWLIGDLEPDEALNIKLEFQIPFEWNLWEGLGDSRPELIVQPQLVTSVFFEDKKNTWYKTYGHPGSLVRTWPTWTPRAKRSLLQRTVKAVSLIKEDSALLN